MSISKSSIIYLFLSVIFFGSYGQSKDNTADLLRLYEKEEFDQVVSKADSILKTDPINLPRIYQIKADALYFLGNIEASLDNYLLAIENAKTYKLEEIYLAQSYSHAGFCLKYLGRNTQAIPYYMEALDLSRAVGDSVEIGNQLSSLGNIYAALGQYEKAAFYLDQCYEIDLIRKDTVALAYDLTSLGDLKCKIGDFTEGINYFRTALTVRESIGDNYATYSLRLGKLSEAFLKNGQVDSAAIYSQKSMKEALLQHDSLTLAKQWINQTSILNAQKEFKKGLNIGEKALSFFSKSEENQFQALAQMALSESYIGLEQYDKARTLLLTASRITKSNNLLEETISIYQRLAWLAEKQKNFDAALACYKTLQMLQDTLQKRDKQNAILALDMEYKTVEREQKITLLTTQSELTQLKAKRANNLFVLTVGIAILIIGFLSIIYYLRIKRVNAERIAQDHQYEALQKRFVDTLNGSQTFDLKEDLATLNIRLHNPLTDREYATLKQSLTGLTNKEISEKLFVSESTVKFHLRNIYNKLGVNNRKEALEYVVKTS